MDTPESHPLAEFFNLTIACTVCGEEWGYPIIETSLEKLITEVISIGWQVKEFPEITGPVCHNCLERPEKDQALDVNEFYTVKFNAVEEDPTNQDILKV